MTTANTDFLKSRCDFAQWYRKAILAKVRELKRDGTVAMSADNLFAIVRVPNGTKGAPVGTNARYYLHEQFRDIVAATPALNSFTY